MLKHARASSSSDGRFALSTMNSKSLSVCSIATAVPVMVPVDPENATPSVMQLPSRTSVAKTISALRVRVSLFAETLAALPSVSAAKHSSGGISFVAGEVNSAATTYDGLGVADAVWEGVAVADAVDEAVTGPAGCDGVALALGGALGVPVGVALGVIVWLLVALDVAV